MPSIITQSDALGLQTRKLSDIVNILDRADAVPGMEIQVNDYKSKFPGADHRPVGPCGTYNCHGLTFAARRTQITEADEIAKILREDEYEQVQGSDLMPGDVAIYFVDGDAEHSGIVIEKGLLVPKILSKWGVCQEVIHWLAECPYSTQDVRYYRICK